MAYAKIRGFAPDIDPTTTGAIIRGKGIIPSIRGIQAAPSPNPTQDDAMTATVVDAVTIEKTDGTLRTFAGTTTQIFELASTAWTDRTRASGTYTAGTSWDFAQLGDTTYATNNVAVPQFSSSGAFADLTGAPVCSIIEAVNDQLFALDTNEGTFGDQPDRWWASAFGDPGDWTPSIASQSVSGRLTNTPGPITAGRGLGSDIVVYKENSIYLGRYIGPPEIWSFQLIASDVGAVANRAVVQIQNGHIFMGPFDFFAFDGTRPQSIGGPIKDYFFEEEIDFDNRSKVRGVYDQTTDRVFFFYVSKDSAGGLDRYIVYHLRSDRWGTPVDLQVEAVFEYIQSTGITYDDLGNNYATYDDLPTTIIYDSPFWSTREKFVAVFKTDHMLNVMNGEPTTADMTFWTVGTDSVFSFLRRVRPRFAEFPTSATMYNSYSNGPAQPVTSDAPTSALNDGKFDLGRSARWHQTRMETVGPMELLGVDIDLVGDGEE